MSAPFTPGPWEVSGNGVWAVSPWNARFRLATVTTPSPMNGVDWQANARLIAEAPAMLSALRGVVDSLSQNRTFPADVENAKRLALAACARVDGEGL